MNERASASSIRAKSRDQLLGYYSIAIGSFAILFAFLYAGMILISGITSALTIGTSAATSVAGDVDKINAMLANPRTNMLINILSYILMAVATPIISIFTTGYLYICREISYERRPRVADLFYGFKHHPDKIIIMSLIIYAVQMILGAPATIYEYVIGTDQSGQQFLVAVIIFVVQAVVMVILYLAVSMCYMVYLDEPEFGAIDCLKASIAMMKGNKWRLFYLMLTFIGYAFLIIFSLGIASLWIIPYQQVSVVNFYRDIKENEQRGTGFED